MSRVSPNVFRSPRSPKSCPCPTYLLFSTNPSGGSSKKACKRSSTRFPRSRISRGSLALELVDHRFGDPADTIEECKERDENYSRPLFVTARFINRDTGEIKEQQVFLGDFPMMTDKGVFIVNGTERVVVSQLVRSPGVYFDATRDKTSDRIIYSSKMIPGRGAWLELDTDKRDTIGVRVDRKRRQYVSGFIRGSRYRRDRRRDHGVVWRSSIHPQHARSRSRCGQGRGAPRSLPQAATRRAHHGGVGARVSSRPCSETQSATTSLGSVATS